MTDYVLFHSSNAISEQKMIEKLLNQDYFKGSFKNSVFKGVKGHSPFLSSAAVC
jgi:hypothetical protein